MNTDYREVLPFRDCLHVRHDPIVSERSRTVVRIRGIVSQPRSGTTFRRWGLVSQPMSRTTFGRRGPLADWRKRKGESKQYGCYLGFSIFHQTNFLSLFLAFRDLSS